MLKEMGFSRGVNLGGWMSQCDYSQERLDGFIREEDLARIAGWGLDHVRLPVDYNVLETEDGSGYREEGFDRIRRVIGWCEKYGLNLVIDLHKTAGFSFDSGEMETGFFSSEAYQERFYRLWEQIASRCGGSPDRVAFELLNEVTDPSFMDTWNRVAGICIRRIRFIAPKHLILVGGYHNNSAHAVPALDPPADSRVIYNFHCYEPLRFTHQGAHWVDSLDQSVRLSFEEAEIPEDYFDRLFAPAIGAAEKNGTELYCGEYGVIENAAPQDTVRWFRMIHDAFERHGISRCVWSYREMNFGLTDARLDAVRSELIRLL
ncbi:MAG: glycoside hydrolase family 5 protein [Clostridiales bacterium]|nr:glycoside hydrolase family 5 protein [Clostridiales bacterium]